MGRYKWFPSTHSHAREHGSVLFFSDTSETPEVLGELDFQDGSPAEFGINGVTNEDVIQVLIERLEALNTPPYACAENLQALTYLGAALNALNMRTERLALV